MEDIAYRGGVTSSLQTVLVGGAGDKNRLRPVVLLAMPSFALRPANINASLSPAAPVVSMPLGDQATAVYGNVGKRVLDIVLVLLILPLALPVIVICALALWVEGGFPFYRQDRLGQHGRRFSILKLRTMVRDADALLEQYLDACPKLR